MSWEINEELAGLNSWEPFVPKNVPRHISYRPTPDPPNLYDDIPTDKVKCLQEVADRSGVLERRIVSVWKNAVAKSSETGSDSEIGYEDLAYVCLISPAQRQLLFGETDTNKVLPPPPASTAQKQTDNELEDTDYHTPCSDYQTLPERPSPPFEWVHDDFGERVTSRYRVHFFRRNHRAGMYGAEVADCTRPGQTPSPARRKFEEREAYYEYLDRLSSEEEIERE